MTPERAEPRWLLLIQQIPRKPDYLRVKIWRRLQRLGAVPIKNAVYALPRSEDRNEDLQWVIREIIEGGGEAMVVEASFIQGIADADVEALFSRARDKDYAELEVALRALAKKLPRRGSMTEQSRRSLAAALKLLWERFNEVAKIDFFDTSLGERTRAQLVELEARLAPAARKPKPQRAVTAETYLGRTWVTRKGIFVDRIASAWLIRRFIDPKAKFRFVLGKGYVPAARELRFDMFEAEFTHVGDRCTFEVLIERLALRNAALTPIAEIVHDIDIKDDKFGRKEAPGIEGLLAGIALRSKDDEERLARGSVVFDDLYELFG